MAGVVTAKGSTMDRSDAEGRPGDESGRGTPGVAARSVTRVLAKARESVSGTLAIVRMNHENGGFDCPGARWGTRAD